MFVAQQDVVLRETHQPSLQREEGEIKDRGRRGRRGRRKGREREEREDRDAIRKEGQRGGREREKGGGKNRREEGGCQRSIKKWRKGRERREGGRKRKEGEKWVREETRDEQKKERREEEESNGTRVRTHLLFKCPSIAMVLRMASRSTTEMRQTMQLSAANTGGLTLTSASLSCSTPPCSEGATKLM